MIMEALAREQDDDTWESSQLFVGLSVMHDIYIIVSLLKLPSP